MNYNFNWIESLSIRFDFEIRRQNVFHFFAAKRTRENDDKWCDVRLCVFVYVYVFVFVFVRAYAIHSK